MNSALALLAASLRAAPPWLVPLMSQSETVLSRANDCSVADALNGARDDSQHTVQFVNQAALPAGESYEAFIARTGCVPTRDNLHDLFNGLIWLKYPNTKRRLNALQAEQISIHGTTGPRGPVRDALTVFDENAALLQAPTELIDALRARDWRAAFIDSRELWQSAHVVLFGHALHEKLMQPRKAITAHVWVVASHDDVEIASSLHPETLGAKPFLPLPVLGVPGWWGANEDPRFYDDADVFRGFRQRD